jgi:hypothetical protein
LNFQNGGFDFRLGVRIKMAGLWVISRLCEKNKIIASKYASNSALIFDPRYEDNGENVQLSFPSESEFNAIVDPFPIWMKLADSGPEFRHTQVVDDIGVPSEPLFGISIIDSYAVNLGKSSRKCRVALVLMGTKLHIGAMQNRSRRCLNTLRSGLESFDCPSGVCS